jgi:hypothetical protein
MINLKAVFRIAVKKTENTNMKVELGESQP